MPKEDLNKIIQLLTQYNDQIQRPDDLSKHLFDNQKVYLIGRGRSHPKYFHSHYNKLRRHLEFLKSIFGIGFYGLDS